MGNVFFFKDYCLDLVDVFPLCNPLVLPILSKGGLIMLSVLFFVESWQGKKNICFVTAPISVKSCSVA